MQRIKTVRWPVRNIGGDRAFAKLRYVKGENYNILNGAYANATTLAFNTGASSGTMPTIERVLGQTPNLSILAYQYLHYRIKGIALKLTYWATTSVTPLLLYVQAASSTGENTSNQLQPSPNFPNPSITVVPEQRWTKYTVCSATAAGARPTTLRAYYSVNKVFGPDAVVKNSEDFTGQLVPNTPYWSTNSDSPARPTKGPWLQWGVTTLSGQPVSQVDGANGVMKVEATVYAEFYGKRMANE